MVRTFAKYGTALIATYLVVAYASGSGSVIKEGAAGGAKLIDALQGR